MVAHRHRGAYSELISQPPSEAADLRGPGPRFVNFPSKTSTLIPGSTSHDSAEHAANGAEQMHAGARTHSALHRPGPLGERPLPFGAEAQICSTTSAVLKRTFGAMAYLSSAAR